MIEPFDPRITPASSSPPPGRAQGIFPLNPGRGNDLFGLPYHLGATRGTTTDGYNFHTFEVS